MTGVPAISLRIHDIARYSPLSDRFRYAVPSSDGGLWSSDILSAVMVSEHIPEEAKSMQKTTAQIVLFLLLVCFSNDLLRYKQYPAAIPHRIQICKYNLNTVFIRSFGAPK